MGKIKREVTKHYSFYLAGAISFAPDSDWLDWRAEITAFLREHGHKALNPCLKHRLPLKEKHKIQKMILRDQIDVAREYIRKRIITPDHELIFQSSGCIAFIDEYSVGTSAELECFYLQQKPVYVVTNLPRKKWSAWFVGLSTLIFRSKDELKKFIGSMEE